MKRLIFSLIVLAGLSAPALAAEGKSDMTRVDTGTVKEILKPDLILLNNDKRYRIDGVRVPPDYAQQALTALKSLLVGRKVNIYSLSGQTPLVDRYGVPLAQIMRDDGLWVEGDMILKGLAWYDVSGMPPHIAETLRDMEAKSRAGQKGFWSNATYGIKTPDTVGKYLNSYQIVEGKILYVTSKNALIYVNFGRDYKTDFTINVPSGMTSREFNPGSWQGREVRVRGWVEEQNGPMVALTDPAQIEFLSDPVKPGAAKKPAAPAADAGQ